ncbi:MAG: glycosyltransferase [Ilumatobacteraceae bacterium]
MLLDVPAGIDGWRALLVDGETLPDGLTNALAAATREQPEVAVWFLDHELLDESGGVTARSYLPELSPEYQRHTDVIDGPLLVRAGLAGEVRRPAEADVANGEQRAQRYAMTLRLIERGVAFGRLPGVVARRRGPARVLGTEVVRTLVVAHLQRSGIAAEVTPTAHTGVVRVRRTRTEWPRVSVVIPTRGGQGRVWSAQRTFVVHAVESLLRRSTHPDIEVVVVADDSTPAHVVSTLERLVPARVRVVPWTRPFNFSEKINAGVAAATGDLLLLLNDDTELIEPASLEAMAALFADPAAPGSIGAVGAVGARLLFDDGTLQHAGHVYNEQPLHAFLAWPGDHPGPGHRLMVTRECSGVTAAALMVDRATFVDVGGFPEDFPLDYNDVAFCLAVRRSGRRILWTPDAAWFHFEGRTRQRGPREDEWARLRAQWGPQLDVDPYHHPELEVRRGDRLERVGRPADSAAHAST